MAEVPWSSSLKAVAKFPYNKGLHSKNRLIWCAALRYMIRFSALTKPPRSFRILTASVTAILLPSLAFAQTTAKKARVDDKNAPATISAEQMTGQPD